MATTLNFLKTRTATFKLTNDVMIQQQVLDCALILPAASEKVGCIVIPAGALVLGTSTTIITPTTTSSAVATLGDEDADNNWQATNIVLTAAANTTAFSKPIDTNPALGGKFYPTASQLSFKLSAHIPTALKIAVTARYAILNAVANAT
jgi:hypothetical protein